MATPGGDHQMRDPRWGRNLETPSEDPAVCGSFGVEVTKGLQESKSDPRFVQAVVTLKHFDANSLEGNWGPGGTITRHTCDAKISQYDLHDTYLPAFRQSVVEGNSAFLAGGARRPSRGARCLPTAAAGL